VCRMTNHVPTNQTLQDDTWELTSFPFVRPRLPPRCSCTVFLFRASFRFLAHCATPSGTTAAPSAPPSPPRVEMGGSSMPSADSMPTTCKHIANHWGWILRRVLGFKLVACAASASLPMVLGYKHRPRTCADECPKCAHINSRSSAHTRSHITAQTLSRMCPREVAVLCPNKVTAKEPKHI
jgi:hypothetical protein